MRAFFFLIKKADAEVFYYLHDARVNSARRRGWMEGGEGERDMVSLVKWHKTPRRKPRKYQKAVPRHARGIAHEHRTKSCVICCGGVTTSRKQGWSCDTLAQ